MAGEMAAAAAACDRRSREAMARAAEAQQATEEARRQREALEQQPTQSGPQD